MAVQLTQEQREEFERQLAGNGLSDEQAQQALEEGARMAQADMQQQDDVTKRLSEYGFESMDHLLEEYERLQGTVSELRGMLAQLLDMHKAAQNAARLDMQPEFEQTRQSMKNRLIQKDWQDSAAQMNGLERLLPEIADYIMEHPQYAQESDGFRRAYDAVRSGKYRDEEELLSDPQFIQRAAGSEKVREAVMRACLEQIRRSGSSIVQSVGASESVGKTPLTGRRPVTGMQQAKKRLEALLGVQG